MSIAVKVENLSKKYVIGHDKPERYVALRDVVADKVRNFVKRPLGLASKTESHSNEDFWALNNVSFELEQGARLGIIGRNGAGKSTLLKILSRITSPSNGRVTIFGKVASLLEVGTGFHPELTGRENIYLNGSVLGMKRSEIYAKFDEIVAFAEVERFLDTPVKHYSSGMYVRLAFSVAAHLNPEILILDEVLAVGDAQFQKKCLGKMGQVAQEGKTIIFVSHSMGLVSDLCDKAILLDRGCVATIGKTQEVIDFYLSKAGGANSEGYSADLAAKHDITISRIQSISPEGIPTTSYGHDDEVILVVSCKINKKVTGSVMGFYVSDHRGRKVFTNKNDRWDDAKSVGETVDFVVRIPRNFLVPGHYSFSFAVSVPHVRTVDIAEDAVAISIIDTGSIFASYEGYDYGCVFADCKWDNVTIPDRVRNG